MFGGYLLVYSAVIVAGIRSRAALRLIHGLPRRAARRVVPLFGRRLPDAPVDHAAADELYDALHVLLRRPRAMVRPGLHALLVEALGVLTIWGVLLAFGERTGPAVPLAGYSFSVVFGTVGFLPAGIGFAEASLGAVFVSHGIAGGTAAVAVLTYRLFHVWLPLVIGAWAAHAVTRQQGAL